MNYKPTYVANPHHHWRSCEVTIDIADVANLVVTAIVYFETLDGEMVVRCINPMCATYVANGKQLFSYQLHIGERASVAALIGSEIDACGEQLEADIREYLESHAKSGDDVFAELSSEGI